MQSSHDVHAILVADGLQRLTDISLEGVPREVILERSAVDEV